VKRRLAAILILAVFLPALPVVASTAGADERPVSPMEKDLRELFRIADSYPTRAKTPDERAQALALWHSVEARLVKELQASPHDFDLELWLGDCYRMGHNLDVEGAWDKAVLHLKEAARLRPDSPLPLTQLGELYAASGHPAEAEAPLLQALKLSGDKPPASIHQYLAFTYYQLGQFGKVVAQADEYLKTDPDSQLIKLLKERSEAALRGERKPRTFELQKPKDEKAAEPSSFLLYYMKPQPDRFPSLLAGLQKDGALALGHMTAAGFLAQVFHDNPDRLNGWVPAIWKLGDAARAYVWLSLWFSGTPQAKAILEDVAHKENGAAADSVTKLLKVPSRPLLELPIDSGSSLDLLWGAFFATGRPEYVAKIIGCLPWSLQDPKVDKLKVAIGRAAEWSLRTNAGRDPRVLEICKTELARSDGDTRTVLVRVIREVPKPAVP
jgi:tetratricopeptide (TPR) repeat protein